MKELKWLYRLESTDPDNGLWYNSKGKYCFGIGKLDNCSTKDLPMGYDERYKPDGLNGYSSCSNIEDLWNWYSYDDAKELIKMGFKFYKYASTDYCEYPKETVFLKDKALARIEIPIETLYSSKQLRD